MPAIVRVACAACEFAQAAHIPLTLVVDADGAEHICPHPGERRTAERITGVTWRELDRQNRILHRYALFCTTCGDVHHYAVRERKSRLGFIAAITLNPKQRDAEGVSCQSCGSSTLSPLDASFADVPCPSCKQRALSSDIVGVA